MGTPLIISILGVTNVGKSSLLDKFNHPLIHKIEVGKELRSRHPPEYFNGLAALHKTEEEVWEIFNEQYKKATQEGARVILVDGQPRLEAQVDIMFLRFPEMEAIWLFAPHKILEERAKKRDKDKKLTSLSEKRLINDYRQLHIVIACLMRNNVRLCPVDTSEKGWQDVLCRNITKRAEKLK